MTTPKSTWVISKVSFSKSIIFDHFDNYGDVDDRIHLKSKNVLDELWFEFIHGDSIFINLRTNPDELKYFLEVCWDILTVPLDDKSIKYYTFRECDVACTIQKYKYTYYFKIEKSSKDVFYFYFSKHELINFFETLNNYIKCKKLEIFDL